MSLFCTLLAPAAGAPLPGWVKVDADIPYSSYKQTLLDVLQPVAQAKGKRPGLIMLHGGGWVAGSKSGMTAHCLRYVARGFVVANVEYRLAAVATAPAAVEDAMQAARWFFRNARRYHVDRRRIVVVGGSAGGHLALMTAMAPKSAGFGPRVNVAGVVSFASIAELEEQLEGPFKRAYTATWIPEQPGRVELARRLSPANYVRRGLPAALLIHGELDQTHGQATRLSEALRKHGVDSTLITVPKGHHAFQPEEWERLFPQIFDWLTARGILREGGD